MSKELLQKAREYELAKEKEIKKEDRPAFHLSTRVGWMNDPNGFSFYDGCYHMFYQYHPYDASWGPMHWGHAISKDLLHWEYLPCVLAPDMEYDSFGCFSGNAITMKDGSHLLMYTSVVSKIMEDGTKKEFQHQSIAIGDGREYVKSALNPVISTDMLPSGYIPYDFRDPKIWLGEDSVYRALIGGRKADGFGALLLYKSEDAKHWTYEKAFAQNSGEFGLMWECPDFFEFDGTGVILVSPTDMQARGYEYHSGNGTLALIGDYNKETEEFIPKYNQSIDYGIDFYAPESLKLSDGRQVMIGWMQNWETLADHSIDDPYFGQMSVPRELSVKNGRLYQSPIRELEDYRRNKIEYKTIVISNEALSLEGICGRYIDMLVELDLSECDRFIISLACDVLGDNDIHCQPNTDWIGMECHTDFVIRPKEKTVTLDRSCSGSRRDIVHSRHMMLDGNMSKLKVRFILDRNSIEAFWEDGREAMTTTVKTDLKAAEIRFEALGRAVLNVEKYTLEV